jgi:flagellar biosynthesis/type III secretory pathway protein FliH
MSKKFRPIFEISKGESFLLNGREEKKTHQQDPEKELRRLQEKVTSLEREKENLIREVATLKELLSAKEKEVEKLRELRKEEKVSEEILREISMVLGKGFEGVVKDIKKEYLEIARKVIKDFLLTDILPKEEIVIKVLSQVFEKTLDLKGSVSIHLNPSDVDRVYDFVGELREKLSEKLDIEIEPDPTLKEGEVRVETPKFIIERKHDEILEEIFREAIKNVLEGG